MSAHVSSGLDGVIAAETRISGVDGEAGELIIAGYPLAEIAGRASFEEITYLLLYDSLPIASVLTDFSSRIASRRTLPPPIFDLLASAAKSQVAPMDALLMAAATLSLDNRSSCPNDDEAIQDSLIAALPTIVAAYYRLLQGKAPITPLPELSHAANYLAMITGEDPSEPAVRAMNTYLCTVADHGLNASTFTARVIISTRSDMISAIVGAIGALKGPLHGGAPGPVLDMLNEIGTEERAENWIRSAICDGRRLMGFGHRIYKVRDPRADVLAAAASQLYSADADRKFYSLAMHVEKTALRLLEELKPGRRLHTNVEFYTALLLHGIGLPSVLFAPTFAIGRVAGWIAHCREQQKLDRLIRPQSVYVGAHDRQWTPVELRA